MNTKTVSPSSPSPSPSPPWIDLPEDVTANILQRLGVKERLESAQLVCTTWRRVCLDPAMWRVIELIPPRHDYTLEHTIMCDSALSRSQGQLIDLRIVCFDENKLLLHFIAEHSRHLQRLTIANCFETSGAKLLEMVKMFPQIEELHIIMVNYISAKEMEAIGIYCPMLKSFSYHWYEEEPPVSNLRDEYALAIGKTMPNLHHLQLLSNWKSNKRWDAIIDRCRWSPLLDELGVKKRLGLDIRGAIRKRFSKQIENLRYPEDVLSNFECLDVDYDFCDLEKVESQD